MFRSRSKSSARFLLHPPASPGSLRASSSRFDEAISLNDIMRNRTELEHFKVYSTRTEANSLYVCAYLCINSNLSQIFLNERLAAQDLMCWMEIEAFRGIPASDRTIRDIKAKQLRTNYFNKKYFFGPNSPATKEQQRQVHSITLVVLKCSLLSQKEDKILVNELSTKGTFSPLVLIIVVLRVFEPPPPPPSSCDL